MSAPEDDPIEKLLNTGPLSPWQQRRLWACVSTIKKILIKAGLTTHEEFEATARAMMNDIDNKNRETILKELGGDDADAEGDRRQGE